MNVIDDERDVERDQIQNALDDALNQCEREEGRHQSLFVTMEGLWRTAGSRIQSKSLGAVGWKKLREIKLEKR